MGLAGNFAAGYLDATMARQIFVVFNQLVELSPLEFIVPGLATGVDRLGMLAVPAINGIVGTVYALMGRSNMFILGSGYNQKEKVLMAVGSTMGGVLQAPVKAILPPVVGFDLVEPLAVGAGMGVGYAIGNAL